jgi:hypothetical protein
MGKYHDVSRKQLEVLGTAVDSGSRPALGQEVVNDDVFGSLAKECGDFARRRRADAPWRCEVGVIKTAPWSLTEWRISERASIRLSMLTPG